MFMFWENSNTIVRVLVPACFTTYKSMLHHIPNPCLTTYQTHPSPHTKPMPHHTPNPCLTTYQTHASPHTKPMPHHTPNPCLTTYQTHASQHTKPQPTQGTSSVTVSQVQAGRVGRRASTSSGSSSGTLKGSDSSSHISKGSGGARALHHNRSSAEWHHGSGAVSGSTVESGLALFAGKKVLLVEVCDMVSACCL